MTILNNVHNVNGSVLTRQGDDLFLDGVKLTLCGAIYEDCEGDRSLLRYGKGWAVADDVVEYIFHHPELIPECWKLNEEGKPRRIFHSQGFEHVPSGGPCDWVVYMVWTDDKWVGRRICEFEWEDYGDTAYDIILESAV